MIRSDMFNWYLVNHIAKTEDTNILNIPTVTPMRNKSLVRCTLNLENKLNIGKFRPWLLPTAI